MVIYFMGICGTAMGNTALMLKNLGHDVCGADSGIYPPMSDLLENAGISITDGFNPHHLEALDPDLVVVGNAISRGNPEIEWLLDSRRFPFTSLPALLHDFILKDHLNIVVTGTHGKTTTSALTAFLLKKAGSEPGYLIGGVPRDLTYGAHEGNKNGPFVIEGDEYDSALFDKRSKFIHYLPTILIINNIEYDHSDIFRDLSDVQRSFSHLLRTVPSQGRVLVNGDDRNIAALLPVPWTRVIRVGSGTGNDLRIGDFQETSKGSRFKLYWHEELWGEINWNHTGLFNARNAAMAALAAGFTLYPENPMQFTLGEFEDFKGVKRRQELLIANKSIIVLEDFAHHPTAIEQTIESLRHRYPQHKITAGFEPRSNTARTPVFQEKFAQSLSFADQVMIGPVHRADKLPPEGRLDTEQLALALSKANVMAKSFADNKELLEVLWQTTLEGNGQDHVIIFFTNGSFDGIIQTFVERVSAI